MNTALRNVKTSAGRWFGPFGLFALVLLALPNCAFPVNGLPPEEVATVFEPGEDPAEAIFCDIPKPLEKDDDGCATQDEADDQNNISLAEAATALVSGEFKFYALDYSDDARNLCGGRPKKIDYFGEFPAGFRVCINCGTQMPDPYPTMVKACIAKCQDLVNQNGIIPDEGAAAFCEANVKLSTNHDPGMCYKGACTGGGNSMPGYDDPRKHQEKVVWVDPSAGVDVFGADNNSIKRTAPATVPADFNEGAGSAQTITTGDGWVEFEAGQNGVSHVIGLRASCADPGNCPDNDYGLTGIGFAISLNANNGVYVLEGGTPLVVEGPFGAPYTPGERFRVRATANSDGTTATISYTRLANCKDGVCSESLFWTSQAPHPSYPLRVDATFREENATLENVTIVRIVKQ